MCFPAIDQYRGNTCEIFKMINRIAWEHIPASIKLNNVFARYQLDSGQTSFAIFKPLKWVNKTFLKARYGGNISRYWVDCGRIHYGIKFFNAGGHMVWSEHMKSCLVAQICFVLFQGPWSSKKIFLSAEMLTNLRPINWYPSHPPSFFILHYL